MCNISIMPTFECNGLMDPKNMKPQKIVYNNLVLNGLTKPMNFNSEKMNFNITERKKIIYI